ncbi:MAG: acyl-CoA dehydratase activase [Syntrophales bacterium]
MITAGIDVGIQTVKAVIVRDNQLLSHSLVMAGWDPEISLREAMDEAMEKAGVSQDKIGKITATGIGRKEVSFANDYATEVTCDAKGAAWLFPSVRTVIDIGAEESRGAKCDSTGKVLDFVNNDKCAAGVGAFVEAMARALEVKIEDMAELSLQSQKEIAMNVTCVIFAESEVISLIHAKTPKHDIARAIHDAISSRTTAMVRRIGIEKDVAMIGGVAKNAGVIDSLRRYLGVDVLVPENPQIVGALGAALLAVS